MPTLKPKHVATVGRVRLTLLAGNGGKRSDISDFTIERRQDENAEGWYPAAGFQIGELDSLAEAVELARRQRDGTPSKDPAAEPVPEPPSPAPVEAVPEEPPFDPTGPAAPVVVSTTKTARAEHARPGGRSASKKKTRRVIAVKAKARSRSR